MRLLTGRSVTSSLRKSEGNTSGARSLWVKHLGAGVLLLPATAHKGREARPGLRCSGCPWGDVGKDENLTEKFYKYTEGFIEIKTSFDI